TQNIGTVVVTLGTTATGAVDPLDEILKLQQRHNFRIHVDAAYGGYFTLAADLSPRTRAAFDAIPHADSIVIDPHKHGLQPYGCGCVLFADPSVGTLYAHDSPYTYFTSRDLHLGEISLECSRAGAAAAALWTTLEALPLSRAGLGAQLAGAREAALALVAALGEEVALVVAPELDIVCPFPRTAPAASAISAACERAFDTLAAAGWHVAKLRVDTAWLRRSHPWVDADAEAVTTLRLVLMKPSHLPIAGELARALEAHLVSS
ncbi:MAG: pyridoxal-dependent decarboxylase, partial [Solirubrobacteraceae bacterium]